MPRRLRPFAPALVTGLLFLVPPAGRVDAVSAADTFAVVHDFDRPSGSGPLAGLIADSSGALYGTASQGGGPPRGGGVVYKLTPSGSGYTYSVLHHFHGYADGWKPSAGLIIDSRGDLYGTTAAGGSRRCQLARTCGTVFELIPNGSSYEEKILYRFGGDNDGSQPVTGLVADSSGALYGTTLFGGPRVSPHAAGRHKCFENRGCGTVFKLSPSGSGYSERILYTFKGGSTGWSPQSGLIIDSHGELYGTTFLGGNASCFSGAGCGLVYSLTPRSSGYAYAVLHAFAGGRDGANPLGNLFADAAGALYGTTEDGGGSTICRAPSGPTGCGTVFKMTPLALGYVESVLYSFRGRLDGYFPMAGVVVAADGTAYGTAWSDGGPYAGGNVFRLPKPGSGPFSILHSFTGPDGFTPMAPLLFNAGRLYGTTSRGGLYHRPGGTIFSIAP